MTGFEEALPTVDVRLPVVESSVLGGGGGSKIGKFMRQKKPQINSVGEQHTRVDNNKTK